VEKTCIWMKNTANILRKKKDKMIPQPYIVWRCMLFRKQVNTECYATCNHYDPIHHEYKANVIYPDLGLCNKLLSVVVYDS